MDRYFGENNGLISSGVPLIKINDFGKTTQDLTNEEIQRCKLASLYRLVYLRGWSPYMYNHITVRCESNPDHFLINPFGLLFFEVTASNLVKIDLNANILDRGTSSYGVNSAGFHLHSAIHESREDVNCVIHIHTATAAIAYCLKQGFFPITQEHLLSGEISYYNYEGIFDNTMPDNIKKALGPKNKIMILINHGVVVVGKTVEEAWLYLLNFMVACESQYRAMAGAKSIDDLHLPDSNVLDQVQQMLMDGVNLNSGDGIQWNLGEMDFECEMRRLDYLGLNSGYPYKKIHKIYNN